MGVVAEVVKREAQMLADATRLEEKAVLTYFNSPADAMELLTAHVSKTGDDLTASWFEYFGELFVKYRDGFTTTMPPKPANPKDKPIVNCGEGGYNQDWYSRIVKETGLH